MGETGENNDKWIAAWTRLMVKNNIGYHYWPYKRMGNSSSMVNVHKPENWDLITGFTESPRNTFDEIRKARPDAALVRKGLLDFLENCKYENCTPNKGYIEAIGMHP
jgi:hypothetical protein